MKAQQRADARARIEAATPGAWIVDIESGRVEHRIGRFAEFVATTYGGSNAFFISNARNDLPLALDALDRVLKVHANSTIGDGCIECTRLTGHIVIFPCDTVKAIEGAS